MRRHDATTALVLLTVGLVAVDVSMYSAAAEDRAPREIFLSEMRLDTLKRRVEKRIEPTYAAWLDLKSCADGLLDRRPHAPEHWHVPGYYRDAVGHSQAKQGLQDDANAVYELALCWRMTSDERFAQAAVRLIDGWVNTVRSTTIAKRLGNLKYALLLIDIGSFTSDFGLVHFKVDAGEIEDFNKPDVVQESNRIGIRDLDQAVLKVFPKAVREAILTKPPKIWEDSKRLLYNERESAVVNPAGGMFVLGSKKERQGIHEQVDAFAAQVVAACQDFCRRHRVKPVRTVITGGGAMITRLRTQIVEGLASTIPAEVYDLMDQEEPLKSLLPKKTKAGPWQHDESEVEARLRENRRIVRAGSSIGGCSNFVDLPIER